MTDQQWRPLTVGTRRGAPRSAAAGPGVRGPTPADQGYISKSWLAQMAEVDRDYSRGARWGQAGRHVDMVLGRADTRALIVHPAGDEHTILSWIVYAEGPTVPVVHFLHTRREARQKGCARELLRRVGVARATSFVFTCHGPSDRMMQRAYPGASFHPLYRFLGLPGQFEDPATAYKTLPPGER